LKYNDEVSTFAWFQATGTAKVAESNNTAQILSADPHYSTESEVDLPVKITITPADGNDVALATYLTAAPEAPSKIRTGESYSEGLWSGWANGSDLASGVTYTKKDSTTPTPANLKLYQTYTVTIEAPDNTLNESGGVGTKYAYIDGTTGVKYTHDDIVGLIKGKYIDLKVVGVNREAVASRAKFFGFSTVEAPNSCSAAGVTELNSKTNDSNGAYSEDGYRLDTTTAIFTFYFGLYVEGSTKVDSTAPHGDFKVVVTDHSKAFVA